MCNFCKKYFSSIKHPAPAFITCLQDCNNTHPAYAHRRGVECKALHPPSNDARTRDASWYTGRDFSECFPLFSKKGKKRKRKHMRKRLLFLLHTAFALTIGADTMAGRTSWTSRWNQTNCLRTRSAPALYSLS